VENRPSSARLTFLGNPSPWIKQFLGTLQKTGAFEIRWEISPSQYLASAVPRNRVGIAVLENSPQSRQMMEALRQSGRNLLFIWLGKTFTKEDLLFASEVRVHTVLEDPSAEDPKVLEKFRRVIGRADSAERSEDLLYAIKTVMLQMGDDGGEQVQELKTGLLKLEKTAATNKFSSGAQAASGQSGLPFYKAQAFADALLTVQDLERTGSLQVKSKVGLVGKVDFIQGRPVSASCGETHGLKAIYRMFLWEQAEYSFTRREASDTKMEEHFNFTLREICHEGESLQGRFEKIRNQVPPPQIHLQIVPAGLNTSTKLGRPEFSTLSSVVELGKVSQILDYNPLPDVVLYECLIELKKHGLIRVAAA
jgi:hypothetical protein